MRTKKNAATGLSVLPTATTYKPASPSSSAAFLVGQIAFVMRAVDPDQPHAHVERVVVTADAIPEGWEAGAIVRTKHAGGKQLPDREIESIYQDGGYIDGAELSAGDSFPHWELMENGATREALADRIAGNRARFLAEKESAKAKKAAAKKTVAPTA